MVQQAYVCGVSTRCVDQLVESLGLRISRSEVGRVCVRPWMSTSRRYYPIEAEDLDAAIEVAVQIPAAWGGAVEMRPVMAWN